ncbi:Protein of unknown function [Cotesia congregata]|uniref:Uncharacterized protein n=1 Tax=Cotesia congregata TaxID=51543 RepID=A0A8J2HQV0_COTCN|nr:Protein of unknown function [Cotesia congregata]
MDDKLNTEKSDLQLGKGNFAKVVQIVNKIQQQLQNEKDYNHLREYLWLSMNSEKRMRDQNESNYHCWYQLSTSYLLVFKLLVIVVQTDLRYFFSLQVINGHKNDEAVRTECRILESYEVMKIDLETTLRLVDQNIDKVTRVIGMIRIDDSWKTKT